MSDRLRLFDPSRDAPQDVGYGGPSTEYLATSRDDAGQWFNHPTIYWRDSGPEVMDYDRARAIALLMERMEGGVFPRYPSEEAAIEAAKKRSAGGGGLLGALMQGVGP